MEKYNKPSILYLESIGEADVGYITIAEQFKNIPFEVKRVYWTYFTPNNIERGNHAHRELKQVIVAVSGIIKFTLEDITGNRTKYILDSPSKGLYIPSMYWRKIKFSHNAVLLCLASEYYREDDYIRDYSVFLKK